MAFFKSRKGGDDSAAASGRMQQPETIEAMRRRAKHRLVGAAVLVLVGVVGFPLLFDTQPRPISVDIPIEIPDRNKVKPLPAPAPRPSPAVTQAPPVSSAPAASSLASAAPPPAAPPAADKPKQEPKVVAKAEPAAAPPKPAARAEDGAKALAILEAKPAAAEGRFVVQVGAFADVAKAREARQKVERAGLKTYTQVVATKDGKRIRVRLGPFSSRADADKAAEKVKGLDLPASVLTL
jgi:DedD protein